MELAELLEKAERLAMARTNGHLSLLRFAAGWRVGLGIVSGRADEPRTWVGQMFEGETLAEALEKFLNAGGNIKQHRRVRMSA